jgi:SPP1 gp7 family putative phage head morphogenesis protein
MLVHAVASAGPRHYRRDAAKPSFKARARRALRASPAAEARYVSDLRKILKGVHEGTAKAVLEQRHDAAKVTPIHRVIGSLGPHIAKYVGAAFDRMAATVNRTNAEGSKLLGITPRAIGLEEFLAGARKKNIALIHSATLDYADQVRELLEDPDNFGLRVEELAELLEERAGVSTSRAELIARDQTLKTNADLTRERHTRSGIERFTWSTSNDERVRESHAELEGQAFSWDDLPEVDGEEAFPGSPVQCRCVPVPILDDGDDSGSE